MNAGEREEIEEHGDRRVRRVYDGAGRLRIEGHFRGPVETLVNGKRWLGDPAGPWRFFDEGALVAERDFTPHRLAGFDDDELLAFARTRFEVPAGAVFVGGPARWGVAYKNHWRHTEPDGRRRRIVTHENGRILADAVVPTWDDDAGPAGDWRFWDDEGRPLASVRFAEDEGMGDMVVFDADGAERDRRMLPIVMESEYVVHRPLFRAMQLTKLHLFARAVREPRGTYHALASQRDWTALEDPDPLVWYAFGETTHHVPELVNALVSEDRELAISALHALGSDTWHQTTLYEAGARLAPILVTLLAEPRAPHDALRELLALYAQSTSRRRRRDEPPYIAPMRKALYAAGFLKA